jgi:type VI secretion system secreted protein VgrG
MASEGVNVLSSWRLGVVCSSEVDCEAALGQGASLFLVDTADQCQRSIGLIVTEIALERIDESAHAYAVTLRPPVWALMLSGGYAVFQMADTPTVQDIVKKVLAGRGFSGDKVSWRLAGTYPTRPQCMQYEERDWDFVERLLAEEGISYWFDWKDGTGPTIVFGDSPKAHDGIATPVVVPLRDAADLVDARCFRTLEVTEQLVTESVYVRDYDIRHPDVLVEGNAGKGPLEYYEYPALVPNKTAATGRAKARLEQLQRFKRTAYGLSDCIRVQPGRLLDLERCTDAWMNGTHLVVRVNHAFRRAAEWDQPGAARSKRADANDGGISQYDLHVVMVPMDPKSPDAPAFRPDLPQRAPKIEGLEPAVTTGPSGEEIHVDDLGRVKIRFPWDRSNVADDKSGYWVRTLQPALGGSMELPRVGWEVPVGFLDGNPDQPIVLGRNYNAKSITPYAMPGHSATTTFQTASSPGGGATSEFRMGDSAGSQEMFVHSQKDHTVTVGGARTVKVGANHTQDVALSLAVGIMGSQTLTVGGPQSVNVTTDYNTEIKGARSESVAALETTKVTGDRLVSAGGSYVELIGALHGLQCNQHNHTVKGAFTQAIGSTWNHGAALGLSETCAGARGLEVGGGYNVVCATEVTDTVRGLKKVTCGASSVECASIGTQSLASMTISVGGSATLDSSGSFTLEGAEIMIDVGGDVTAESLSLSGGTFKATKGGTNLDGTITRQDVTKLEK